MFQHKYNFSQVQCRIPDDGRRPKHAGTIFMCILMQILTCFFLNKKNAFVGEWTLLTEILSSCLGVTGQSIAWNEGDWSGIQTANDIALAPPLAPTEISASTSLVTWWQTTTTVRFQGEIWLPRERQVQENTTLTFRNREIIEFKKASHRQINAVCVALRITYTWRTQHISLQRRVSD